MKNIVIVGLGEVGEAIKNIEEKAKNNVSVFEVDYVDDVKGTIDVMHICIPFSKTFHSEVVNYIKSYKPKLTIIHSTVGIGTTDKIFEEVKSEEGYYIVHSPIRGIHPNLTNSILLFDKYIGGDKYSVSKAYTHLKSIGITPIKLGCTKTTELAKILSTTYYGWNILFAKEVEKLCINYGLDFKKVYTEPNKMYNEGYTKLGMGHVVRPVLEPPKGRIGGHCITKNIELLPNSEIKRIYNLLNET